MRELIAQPVQLEELAASAEDRTEKKSESIIYSHGKFSIVNVTPQSTLSSLMAGTYSLPSPVQLQPEDPPISSPSCQGTS